jgi:hypothetical protein
MRSICGRAGGATELQLDDVRCDQSAPQRLAAGHRYSRRPGLRFEIFLELDTSTRAEPVAPASDGSLWRGPERSARDPDAVRVPRGFEPAEGLLFCTDHLDGGELVFAHDPAATDVDAVGRDCSGRVLADGNASERGHRRRAADGGAAEDGVAVVEDGGLTPGHAARWAMQADAHHLAV